MQKSSFNWYREMQNILVSHSITPAQKPLNETGTSRLYEDSKLLVTLSQKKVEGIFLQIESTNERTKYLWLRAKSRMTQPQKGSLKCWIRHEEFQSYIWGGAETISHRVIHWRWRRLKGFKIECGNKKIGTLDCEEVGRNLNVFIKCICEFKKISTFDEL